MFDAVNALDGAPGASLRDTCDATASSGLIKGLGPGGAERLLVEHARGRRPRAVRLRGRVSPRLEAAPRSRARGAGRAAPTASGCDPSSIPAGSSRSHRLLRRGRYDVVHAHSPVRRGGGARRWSARCSRTHRPAFVYTEHNRWPSLPAPRPASRTQLTFASTTRPSRCPTTFATRSRRGSATRVEVIVHGVDIARVRAELARPRRDAATSSGVGAGEVLAVTVANLRDTQELSRPARRGAAS